MQENGWWTSGIVWWQSLFTLFFSRLKRKENAQRHYAFEMGMIPSEPK